jgi:hypothetical protein
VLLKADLYDRGRHTELRARDEPRRPWLARGQRGESVNDDVQHDERDGHDEQIGVVDERPHVQPRAEDDEEERDEEAFGDAADLRRQPLRPPDRGHHQPHAESAEEHAGAALLRDPCQAEQHSQRETQVQRPTPLLGALSQLVNPRA